MSYTVRHSAGRRGEGAFGWWIGLTPPGHSAPEQFGPYDNLSERQAIIQAHKDAGLPDPFDESLAANLTRGADQVGGGLK
jgi:hypothetical protein